MTLKKNSDSNQQSLANSQRKIDELTTLYEISKAMNSSTDLEYVMSQIMEILHKRMGMERGTLTLLDRTTNQLEIEVARGLAKSEIERGRYRVGEGITGKVVAAGEPIVVPNVGTEPLFLNRTRARGDIKRGNISFICVPIKLDQKTIGALSVDRLFSESISFEEDIRLLTIISSMVAQTVRIHMLYEKEKEKLQNENILLKQELKKKFHPANMIGESKRIIEVYDAIEQISKTSATVILRGESGTGKEMVAHAIHYSSDRADKPFIKVSCAALPDTLLESELFGYEKGAFTGAATTKIGRFEMAHGGTLFLDEIGDIPASTQVKLLRVLQEKEFERLGGTQTIRVDIRLITATNRDLETEIQSGNFREDLYYRLNVIPIFLPPLKERYEDIPTLANHFLQKAANANKKNVKYFSDEAIQYLLNYSWPGNVRELENAIERAVVLCKTDILTPDLFPIPGVKKNNKVVAAEKPEAMSASIPAAAQLPDAVEALEKQMIEEAMRQASNNQRKASKSLGITERILGYKLKKYRIAS